MFLITAFWRKSRKAERPGTVSLKLMSNINQVRQIAQIALGLESTKDEMMTVNKPCIEEAMKLVYLISEQWVKEGRPFSIHDLADEFGKQYPNPDSNYATRLNTEIEFDRNIATFGRDFMSDGIEEKLIMPQSNSNILTYFDYLIQKFKNDGKLSTSRNIRSTEVCLSKFLGDREVILEEIDSKFITDFNSYLADSNLNDSTVSFYIRTLKLVLFQARSEGLIVIGNDWFDRVNVHIDKSGNSSLNKALPTDAIRRFADFDFSHDENLALARDVFMFCFYMNGMEWNDAALLKPENILTTGFIRFNRRQKGVEKRIPIGAKAKAIIDKYLNSENPYIFPMVIDGTPRDVLRARSSSFHYIKKAGKEAGINDISFNRARATWLALTQQTSIAEQLI